MVNCKYARPLSVSVVKCEANHHGGKPSAGTCTRCRWREPTSEGVQASFVVPVEYDKERDWQQGRCGCA